MSRTLLLGTVLLAAGVACSGAPDGRQTCDRTAACPADHYCARTTPRTCWPDLLAPVVSQVTVTCSTSPCRRDALLTVEALAHDAEALATVTAALDLDGGSRRVELVRVAGELHRATVRLAEWPFPGADLTVTATVRAEDEVGKAVLAEAAPAQRPAVTRRGPVVELDTGAVLVPTAPAVLDDGTVLVAGSTGRLYAVPPGAAAATILGVALPGAISHPPVVGRSAIWVVAGNRLFAVSLDGAGVLNGAGYDAGGTIPAPPAVTAAVPTAQKPEVAFVGSAGGRMAAVRADATANGLVDFIGALGSFSAGPVLANDTAVIAVTSTAEPAATMRHFTFPDGLREGTTVPVGQLVNVPPALAIDGGAWLATAELSSSAVLSVAPDGTPGPSAPLGSNPGGGPVVLADGSAAISVGGTLRRFLPSGLQAWVLPAPLSGAGLTPIVLAGAHTPTTLLVPTRAGGVDAVRAEDGARLWSASLTVNAELREGAVWPAADGLTSLAWFTSGDGFLYALVVDGALDPDAPWPKAWHDARNTGNLTTPR